MDNIRNNLKYIYYRAKSTLLPQKIHDFEKIRDPESNNRIIDPPKSLIPNGEYKEVERGFGSRKTTVKVMKTSHGYYMKPKKDEKLFEACYEGSFGFGLGCSGFDPERVVYYPSSEDI